MLQKYKIHILATLGSAAICIAVAYVWYASAAGTSENVAWIALLPHIVLTIFFFEKFLVSEERKKGKLVFAPTDLVSIATATAWHAGALGLWGLFLWWLTALGGARIDSYFGLSAESATPSSLPSFYIALLTIVLGPIGCGVYACNKYLSRRESSIN